jgi:HEAT repeat protein
LLFEINIASGLFWAGVGLAQFNLLIGFSPPDKTPIYVATMAAVTGLTGGLAPLAGSAVLNALAGWHGQFLGLPLTNYHIVFMLSGLLRGTGLIFLRPLVDARARSTRDVLRQLGRVGPRDWRNLHRLQRTADADVRLRATEALGESRTRLASTELQAALRYPSLAVREEAARALGEIGDRGAVEALLAAMRDPASGLTGEAARALGRLGDRRANRALGEMLNSPPDAIARRDRLTIARALGELGGVDAVDALLLALESAHDEELAETLVEALGRTGAARATPALIARLNRPDSPRGLRLAVIRALGEIGDPACREPLRAELDRADDDAALLPLLADALARLRDPTAVTPLLDRLNALASSTARRQVAHAIGRLIGQGETAYSLLSHDESARDDALARLTHDLQRPLRSTPEAGAVREAQEACITGDYGAALSALRPIVQEHPLAAPAVTPCDVALQEFANWLLEYDGSAPAEIVLLTFCALRGLLLD